MKDKKELAIVLMSGGMDSALCAAIANKDGFRIAALHVNYGQRTQERELKAFNDLADYYSVEHRLVVDIGYLVQIGGSSLTDTNVQISEANLSASDIPTSYVPFRNGNLLSIAASWAETIGGKYIYIGAMEQDSSGYPDCRKIFFEAFNNALNHGTKPETSIKIITPIINYSKKDIILKGKELVVPFHLTWSCYQNSEIACGVCDSCALRLRGFKQSGLDDPIQYHIKPDY